MTLRPPSMRRALALAALAVCAPAQAQDTVSPESAADLGVARPVDLLAPFDAWSWTTADGFSVFASPADALPGLGPVENAGVLLDGVPALWGVLGRTDLNRLPLDVSRLASVEAVPAGRVEAGQWAPQARLRLQTAPPPPGVRATAGAWAANDTGDPGPYQYVDLSLPNAERSGPDAFATLSVAGRRWSVVAHALRRRQGLSFDAPSRRIPRAFDSDGGSVISSRTDARIRIGLDDGVRRHRLAVTRSQADDFALVEPIGREIPTATASWSVRAAGEEPVAGVGLAYGIAASQARARARARSRLPYGLDWDETRTHAFAEARLSRGAVASALGAAVSAHDGRPVDDAAFDAGPTVLPALYAGTSWRRADGAALGGGVHVTGGGVTAPAAWMTFAWPLRPAIGLALRATAGLRRTDAAPSFWLAHQAGYGLAARAGLDVASVELAPASRHAAVHAEVRARLSPTAHALVEAFVHAGDRLPLVDQTFDADPMTGGVTGPARVTGEARGRVAGLRAATSVTGSTWRASAGYVYAAPGGDALVRQLVDRRPRHRLVARAGLAPDDRFALTALARVEGARRWDAYADADLQTDGVYTSRMPAHLALDVTARKRLWGQRLDGAVSVRNLIGRPLRTHALGPSPPVRLSVRVVLRAP